MPRLIMEKYAMPLQPAAERVQNFTEVALGYDQETAVAEAKRCLECKKPKCIEGCPVEVPIPQFISLMKTGDFQGAIRQIKAKNSLPAVCGRVCPQESQCEQLCILGKKGEPVAIGRLERFVADYQLAGSGDDVQNQLAKKVITKSKKVAVVGAGPAGLTAAGDLAKMGYQVTVLEALHVAGGVLMYGIPEFRLPKAIVQQEIEAIKKLGVAIKTNYVVGQLATVDELLAAGYAAVFIGTGAGLPYFMNVPGENLNGVYSANEFLTRANLMKAYRFPEYLTPVKAGQRVAVIGAGNVAMDAARVALRLGAGESSIVYRRSEKEMPARHEEIEHALEEGVKLALLTSPVEFHGDQKGNLTAMTCIRYELCEPDQSGRCRPVALKGSEYKMPVDNVIMALGQGPNPLVGRTTPDLELNRWGNIMANEANGITSKAAVFAGGDIVSGAATVILAMGAGKKAAQAIDQYLKQKI